MNVCEHAEAELSAHAAQHAQTFFDARPAVRRRRRAVGFVVRGFEDVGHAEAARDAADGFGHLQGVSLAFDNARAGDEKQFTAADFYVTNFERRH